MGRGIAAPPGLRGFSFRVGARPAGGGGAAALPAIAFASGAPEPRSWQFALMRPTEDHVAALCLAGAGQALQLRAFQADVFAERPRAVAPGLIAAGAWAAPDEL